MIRSYHKIVAINTYTPNREALMDEIVKSRLFANYWEVRDAVNKDGYKLPADSPKNSKSPVLLQF